MGYILGILSLCCLVGTGFPRVKATMRVVRIGGAGGGGERESYLYIRKAQADQQLAPGHWTWPGGIKL